MVERAQRFGAARRTHGQQSAGIRPGGGGHQSGQKLGGETRHIAGDHQVPLGGGVRERGENAAQRAFAGVAVRYGRIADGGRQLRVSHSARHCRRPAPPARPGIGQAALHGRAEEPYGFPSGSFFPPPAGTPRNSHRNDNIGVSNSLHAFGPPGANTLMRFCFTLWGMTLMAAYAAGTGAGQPIFG